MYSVRRNTLSSYFFLYHCINTACSSFKIRILKFQKFMYQSLVLTLSTTNHISENWISDWNDEWPQLAKNSQTSLSTDLIKRELDYRQLQGIYGSYGRISRLHFHWLIGDSKSYLSGLPRLRINVWAYFGGFFWHFSLVQKGQHT